MEKKNENRKTLHGNSAKINPTKHVDSLYQSCRVTLSDKKEDETPLVRDENVAYAKKFVEENKK